MNFAFRPPSFVEMVALTQQRITYRLAQSEADRDAIFKLRYRGYIRDGGINPCESQTFTDAWDDAPNAILVGMYLDSVLVSSVRIHINYPQESTIPAERTFGDVLAVYREQDKAILDTTRFAIDDRYAGNGREIPFLTLRIITMAAEYYGVDIVLATVRTEHAGMYKRLCGHKPISEPRPYPLLAKPIVCMAVETPIMCEKSYGRYAFMESNEQERAALFGSASLN